MHVIDGDFKDSQVKIITSSSGKTLEIHARLLVAQAFRLPQDVSVFQLVEKEEGHSFGRYIIMILLSLTVIGLLASIPMYLFGKHLNFKVHVKTKTGENFVMEGDKNDWKEIENLLN